MTFRSPQHKNGVTTIKYTSRFAQFSNKDAKKAGDLARSENTPASLRRAQCYDYIASQTEPTDADTDVPGLLYLNEEKYAAQSQEVNLGTACGGVLPLVIAP